MTAVLVVRPSSLGDLVYALAIVADIRVHRPELAIDWVAEEAFAPVVAMHPEVRRVIPVALRRWRRHLLAPSTWREFSAFRDSIGREHYTAVLDLQEQVKGAVLARMARGTRHGIDRENIREPIATLLHDVHHGVDRDQHFVVRARTLAAAALGYAWEGPPRSGLVAPPPAADDRAPRGRYIVFFHATSRPDKLWPEVRWRALAASLGLSGFAVILPWGTDAERARSERIAEGIDGAIVPPHQSLPELASLVARADAVVGVDTGLVHLAAALATPTVAIFVATDAATAGVAVNGSHACDLGGPGLPPDPDLVRAALSRLITRIPSC